MCKESVVENATETTSHENNTRRRKAHVRRQEYLTVVGEDASELGTGGGFYGLASCACGGYCAQIHRREPARRPGGASVRYGVSLPELAVVSVSPAPVSTNRGNKVDHACVSVFVS